MSEIDNETKIEILKMRNAKLEDELDRCRRLLSESEEREAHAPAPQPDAVEELLEAAEEYAKGGPTSADMRMLIIAIGGVTPNAKKAMELYDSLDEKRDRLMRAASAVRAATATREEGRG